VIKRLLKTTSATTLLLIILAAASASAASFVVSPMDAATRKVKSLEFVTVGFTAILNEGSARDFSISLEAGNGAAVVGAPSGIFLSPGSSESFAATLMVAANVSAGQLIPIVVTLSDSSNPALSVSARLELSVDNPVCAEFVEPPAEMLFANANISKVSVKIRNCGGDSETFELSAHPGAGVTAHGRKRSIDIAPGETVESVFNATISGDDVNGASLTLKLSKDGSPVAETTLFANIARETESVKIVEHKSIDVKLAVGHLMRSGARGSTSVQLTIPGFEEGDFEMRTDIGMQRSESENMRVKRQTHEFRYGDSKLSLGNQQMRFSKRTRSREFREGWIASRDFGSNEIRIGSGGGSGDVRFVKWNRSAPGGVSIGAGRLWNENPSPGVSRMTADSLTVDYSDGDNILVKTELAATTIENEAGASASGSVAGFEGEYRHGKMKIKAFGQTGDRNFQSNGPTKEVGLRGEWKMGSGGRVSADYRKGTSFRALSLDPMDAARPGYDHETFTAGFSRSAPGGISARFSVNRRRRDIARPDNALLSTPLSEDFLKLSFSKNMKPFDLALGLDSGSRGFMGEKGGYGKFAFSAGYKNKSTRIAAEINKTSGRGSGIPAFSSEQAFSFNATYLFPNKKNTIQASWRSGTVEDSFDSIPMKTTRFSFGFNSKLASDAYIDLAYHALNSRGVAENFFFLKYTKDFKISIPYKKYGAVYGVAFGDLNGNGVLDGDERLLRGLEVVCGTDRATTDSEGRYEISALVPGRYELRVSPKTHSVRLTPSPASVGTIKVSYNSRIRADMAMLPVYSVSGRVSVKADSYFARSAGVSPENLRVVLGTGDGDIAYAFTDSSGFFYFENIIPDTYRVALDPEWIPVRAEIVEPSEHIVRCEGGSGCDQLDFTIKAKEKEISFKEFKPAPAFLPARLLLLSVSDFGINTQCYLWNGAPNIPPPMFVTRCEIN